MENINIRLTNDLKTVLCNDSEKVPEKRIFNSRQIIFVHFKMNKLFYHFENYQMVCLLQIKFTDE